MNILGKIQKNRIVKECFVVFTFISVAVYLIMCTNALPGMDGDVEIALSAWKNAMDTYNNGEIPLWMQGIYGGLPGDASLVGQIFYPINVIGYFIFKGNIIAFFAYFYIIHLVILCLGIYLFLRLCKFRWCSALVSTLLAVYCPACIGQRHWSALFAGMVWFPLIVDCVYLLGKKNKWIYACLGGIFLGFSGLALPGHTLLINILVACWVYLCVIIAEIRTVKQFKSYTVKMICLGIIAICICSCALLPAIQYSDLASRYIPEMNGWINGVVGIPVEAFVKHTTAVSDLGALLQYPSKELNGSYSFGIVPVLVSLFGVIGFFRKNESKCQKLICYGMFAFTLCYIVGFVIPYLFYYIPYLNAIREPFVYQPWIVLSLAYFTCKGLDFVSGRRDKIKSEFWSWYPMITCIVVICIAIMMPIYFNKRNALVLIMGIAYLFSKTQKNKYVICSSVFVGVLAITLQLRISIGSLQKQYSYDEAKSRIDVMQETTSNIPYMKESIQNHERHYNFGANAFSDNALSFIGGCDAFGYFNPVTRSNRLANEVPYDRQAILRNVKYWHTPIAEDSIHRTMIQQYGFRHLDTIESYPTYSAVDREKTDLWVTETNGNAWMVYSVVPAMDELSNMEDEEVVAQLSDLSIDFRTTAYVYGMGELDNQPIDIVDNTVEEISYKNHSFTYKVNTKERGILVTSETWYPGWTVYIDGERTDILQVNYCFKGVEVESGTHIVEFKYQPKLTYIGIALGVVSGLFVMVVCVCTFVKYRKKDDKNTKKQ